MLHEYRDNFWISGRTSVFMRAFHPQEAKFHVTWDILKNWTPSPKTAVVGHPPPRFANLIETGGVAREELTERLQV